MAKKQISFNRLKYIFKISISILLNFLVLWETFIWNDYSLNPTSVKSNALIIYKKQCQLSLLLIKNLKHFHFCRQSSQEQTNLDWKKKIKYLTLSHVMSKKAMIKRNNQYDSLWHLAWVYIYTGLINGIKQKKNIINSPC